MDINARSHALRWTRNAYGHLVCTDCGTALTVSKPRPDTLRPVGSDGQRLAINTSNGERLPGGHEAPRDIHDAERSRNSHGHYAGRAEHGALDGQPERNDVSARNAGAGRDGDSNTAGRDDPMKEPAMTKETPSQVANRIYAEQHPEKPEAASEVCSFCGHDISKCEYGCPCGCHAGRTESDTEIAALRAALDQAKEEIARLKYEEGLDTAKRYKTEIDAVEALFKTVKAEAERQGEQRADAAEAKLKKAEEERDVAYARIQAQQCDIDAAVARVETLKKTLRDLISAWQNYPGCYDESPEPDKEIEALCKEAAAVLEGTP